MDVQQLVAAVQACMSPDATTRTAGEEALKQLPATPGGLVNLLRLALEESLESPARQVAAIAFKNFVKKEWQAKEDRPSVIGDADKAAVRNLIMEGIIRAPPTVRVQLEESLKALVASDFPEQWPSLLPALQTTLAGGDQALVSGALRALRIIVRKYEFRDDTDRVPLEEVVRATFPPLLVVFQALLANPSPSPDLAELLKLCCKIFWSSTFLEIPALLATNEQFSGWMAGLLALAGRPVPTEGMPEDPEERKQWPWWKAKKWVYNVSYRLFTKLGDPKHINKASAASVLFAERWKAECSLPFFSAVLQELTAVARGGYMSPRVGNILLQYITAAVESPPTWKVLKDHMQDIVMHVVLPMLSFNDEDAELWEDDPQEYVRKGYDVIEDIYSPKTAALGVLGEICTNKRAKKTQLDPTMAHIVNLLGQFKAMGPGLPQDAARRLDGVLLSVGALASVLRKEPKYKDQLEPMLQQHIAPLFASPYGHLRAKACWLAGVFADSKFAEGKGRGATFTALFQLVITALGDADLPVRVDAAVAIRNFIEEIDDEDIGPLKPLIPDLLQRFLGIAQEVESEDLTASLEALVQKFGPEIAPYAVGVLSALTQQFWRLMAEDEAAAAAAGVEANYDGFNCGALAGYSILSAISSVLEAVSTLPHLYSQLEDVLFPVLERFTSQDGLDVFEEITGIITYLTYFGPSITPRMWTLYPRLLHCIDTWAIDYFPDVLLPLDNYISRGTDAFLASTSPSFLDLTNQTLEKVLAHVPSSNKEAAGATNNNNNNNDDDESSLSSGPREDAIETAAQLMSVILENCRGRIDHCVGPYMTLIVRQLAALKPDEPVVEDALLVAGADALYYNAALALSCLAQAGTLPQFMTALGQAVGSKRKSGSMRHFASKREKKIVILGLVSVLGVPASSLPSGVEPSLGQVSLAALQVLLALKTQEEKADARSDYSGNSSSSSSSDGLRQFDGGRSGSETGLTDDEDDQLDEATLRRFQRAMARRVGFAEEEDEDSDSEDDWYSDDDVAVASPLDTISPYIYFAEVLQGVQASDPARFAAVMGNMDAGAQNAVQGMMAYAAGLRNEQLAEAAAAAVAGAGGK